MKPTASPALDTLVDVLGELSRGSEPARPVTAATRLEEDLELESVDLVWLSERLRDRLGRPVDLPGFVAGLDIDEMIGLTVGDLAAHLSGARG